MGIGRCGLQHVSGTSIGLRRRRRSFRAAWLGLVLGPAVAVAALQPTASLDSYGRQGWTHENGLPQNTVQAIAQTRDGFLWVGTEAGAARFDGVEFQAYDRRSTPALPGNDIRCLLETADGSLWIGSSTGLTRWQDGTLSSFAEHEGVPPGVVRGLFETGDHTLWVWTESGLARWEHGRFRALPEVPGDAMSHVLSGSHGSLWVQGAHQVLLYQSGRWSGHPEAVRFGEIEFLASLRNGTTAVGSRTEVAIVRGEPADSNPQRALARLVAGRELPAGRVQTMMADREGALWIGTSHGLVRWAEGKLERFPVTDTLATASILAVTEDREGDLWVGTETSGLQILRDRRFQIIDTRQGLPTDRATTVVADKSGRVWIGTQSDGVYAMEGGRPQQARAIAAFSAEKGLPSNVILAMAAGAADELWVGTPDGLSVIRKGKVKSLTSADGLPDDFVRSLLAEPDGSVWIGTRHGLVHWTGTTGESTQASGASSRQPAAETYTQADGLGSDLVGAMAHDSHGDLWIGTLGGLSRLKGNTIANYTTANGLSSNVVTALLPLPDGTLLIGTQDHGLTAWDGHRFSAVATEVLGDRSIHAIVADRFSHIWFATDDGIERCEWAPMGGPGKPGCSHWVEFDTSDGLVSRETSTNGHPSACSSIDGRLWFATPRGVAEVDPAHLAINQVPPGVVLKRAEVDDQVQPFTPGGPPLVIPPGHVRFQFDYAALSFVAPQKVRYRYMLQGFDHEWTDAGARRSAYYTNIPPGRYTFRIQAANNDGIWNLDGAELRFDLKPHYYQTRWFLFVAVLFAVSLIVFALRERLRRAERGFQAVLAERTRIAREIHDTLAQGYVGVSVQLEVLAQLLRQHQESDAAVQLDKVREYVRTGLAEARQSIWALRTQDRSENTLPVKLRRLVEAANGDGLEAEFSLFGAYRALPAAAEQEVVRIVQEAIQNVKKHSGAGRMRVQLEYGAHGVTVEVSDNGTGGASEQQGRYGLTGMRERAATIEGTLEIESAAGAGTTVRLRLPMRRDSRGPQREEL